MYVQTLMSSQDSDGYVLPKATPAGGLDLGIVDLVLQAEHDSSTNGDDNMEIDAPPDEIIHRNGSINVISKINSLIEEEEKQLPSWIMGRYKAHFNPYITSTGIESIHQIIVQNMYTSV